MIDLHCHILPQIDDGAADMYESVEMARMAAKNGIDVIVATPHCNVPGIYQNYYGDEYLNLFNKTCRIIQEERIPVRLIPGMEVFATWNLPRLFAEEKVISINHGSYILVEFDLEESPDFAHELLKRLREQGAIPVIAHPERCRFIQEEPENAAKWTSLGYKIQINQGSIRGQFGEKVKMAGLKLLQRMGAGLVVASDAHNITDRLPEMKEVQTLLGEICAGEKVQRCFVTEPEEIVRLGVPGVNLRTI